MTLPLLNDGYDDRVIRVFRWPNGSVNESERKRTLLSVHGLLTYSVTSTQITCTTLQRRSACNADCQWSSDRGKLSSNFPGPFRPSSPSCTDILIYQRPTRKHHSENPQIRKPTSPIQWWNRSYFSQNLDIQIHKKTTTSLIYSILPIIRMNWKTSKRGTFH